MGSNQCQKLIDQPGMDQAILQIRYFEKAGVDSVGFDMSLWMQSQECYKCPLTERCTWNTAEQSSVQLFVDTRYPASVALRKLHSQDDLCRLDVRFNEHGIYNWTVSALGNNSTSCHLDLVNEPGNSDLPILYLFIGYVILWSIFYGAKFAIQYWKRTHRHEESDNLEPAEGDRLTVRVHHSPENEIKSAIKKERLRSLDVFRGISIAIMIFVNLGGGGYTYFNHSPWNGLTVADLVFPWFMFIMGTSAYLSISGAARKQVPLRSVYRHIIQRSIILFLFGIFVNSKNNNDLRTLRILGVLQRFGLTYFIVGTLLCIRFGIRGVRINPDTPSTSIFDDLAFLWIEWLLVITMIIIHTCITFLLPVPGCPSGYLGPGGLADGAQYANCTGGASGYIDRTIISPPHLDTWNTCKEIYQTTVPFDSEGILGTLTATLTVFLGVQAATTLVVFSSHRSRLIRWILWGACCGIAGGLLCAFSKDNGWIPVNKSLWSLSFVLVLASMSFILLSLLYYIIDINHWWNGAPFYQAGMNSIILYLGHEILGSFLPFAWKPLVYPVTHASMLYMNAFAASLFVIIAVYLHYKGIFISL